MIAIVVSICSIVQGAQCREIDLTFLEEQFTPQQCMFYGQVEIAKWQESHPNWRIHGWKCRVINEEKKKDI